MRKQRENTRKRWLIGLKNDTKVVNYAMTAYGGALKQISSKYTM